MIEEDYVLHEAPVATQYVVLEIEGRPEVVIDRVVQVDGSFKWAIRNGFRQCFSTAKRGKWCHERMPSSRPSNWIKRFRFATLEEAFEASKKAVKPVIKMYKRRVEVANEHEAAREEKAREEA